MLNIGKLSPGAADYYVGEVATSAEDYYTGRGEATGRWVGSLRPILGLDGAVGPEDFRALLAGHHPSTGAMLITSQGSAPRAAARRGDPPTGAAVLDAMVDTARAAAHLGVSHQYVRQLVKAGVDYQTALAKVGPDGSVQEPRRYLLAEMVPGDKKKTKPTRWRIPRSELERYSNDRPASKPRPGYDVTLRPPKSVSVLWALSDEPRRMAIPH